MKSGLLAFQASANTPSESNFTKFSVWIQDPSIRVDSKTRMILVKGDIKPGPSSSQVELSGPGIEPRAPNKNGDYIVSKRREPDAFNAMHTFATVQKVIEMFTEVIEHKYGEFTWAWGKDPITVHPFAGKAANAYYSRGQKALKFFYFEKDGKTIYTCTSMDIVAHEVGHALLDGMQPGYLVSKNSETFALHEAFGDLTAIFFMLSQLDICQDIFVESKGNLDKDTFFARIAEQFGRALIGKPSLRNANNDKTMNDVSNQAHDKSQVFTGAIYNILEKTFNLEANKSPIQLYALGKHLWTLLISAIKEGPTKNASFKDIADKMIEIEPNQHIKDIIRDEFRARLVLDAPKQAHRAREPFMLTSCLVETDIDEPAARRKPKPPRVSKAREQALKLKVSEDFVRELSPQSPSPTEEFDENDLVRSTSKPKLIVT